MPLLLVSLSSLEDESDESSDESDVFFTSEALEAMNFALRGYAPDLTGGAASLLSLSSLDDSERCFASAAALASIFLEDTGTATGFSLIGSAFFGAVFLVLLSVFAIADLTDWQSMTVMTSDDTKFWVDHYT